VFYSEPWVDMHNRMKEALVRRRAVVRPPLTNEIGRIRQALLESGLLRRKADAP
jgi:4-hydroxy-tetrahydrodipicolinate synthase